VILNDLGHAAFAQQMAGHGLSAEVARRLFAQVHRPAAAALPAQPQVRGLSKLQHARLVAAGAGSKRIELASRKRSAVDGFEKFLFRLDDGQLVESVAIPLPAGPEVVPEKYVVCISSQAGCALGCIFCATGRLGFQRNLETWEIIEQVARVREAVRAPVRGIVFMGQGEPFLNYDRVIAAAGILCDPSAFAIDARAITISTAGVVPAIRRFTAEGWKYRLAISLTSAIEAKRERLMPVERTWPLGDLLAAARDHVAAAGGRMMLEYVTISGQNVGQEDALALIDRLRGMPVRLNLIDVNDTTGQFAPPTEAELAQFRSWLEPLAQPVVRRYSGGKDVEGACGMLAADHLVQLAKGASMRP
jgi:23S rRNA (adenine2503-C2)-methyltransferase